MTDPDAARYFKHDDFEWVDESGGTGGVRRVTSPTPQGTA